MELFTTTLDELDRTIDRKHEPTEDELDDELVLEKIPPEYRDFLDVFSKKESDVLPPHRTIDHKIELLKDHDMGYSPLYKMSVGELQACRKYLIENLDKGFIVPSQSPFASPILFVKKPNGGLRFCVDYRKLNAVTKKNRYPLPLIDETLARVSRAKIFTKLDIRQAFHRIRVDPDSEDLTSFRTRYGQFKYKVTPFGLTNAPSTFQEFMNETLMDLLDVCCTAYLDDILIYSDDPQEHEMHVKLVLERLRAAGLQADIKKCEFNVTRTKYLGFIVSTDGVEVDPEKIAVIMQWKYPRTVKGVQSFLGFCNFYRRFIQDYGRLAAPLTQLTRADHVFDFDHACEAAFEALRTRLMNAPLLAHFDIDRQCMLETDASDTVVAAVFSQLGLDGEWHPVAYFSKTMAPAESNYPIHDKEMLAIVRAFEHWRAELEGTADAVQVLSDHKALEYFMTTKSLSARQARWAEILSRYNFKILYKPGRTNKADPLTRMDTDTEAQNKMKTSFREQTLLRAENLDPQILDGLDNFQLSLELSPIDRHLDLVDEILQSNRNSDDLSIARKLAHRNKADWSLTDGLLKRKGRVVVTKALRTRLLTEAHCQIATAHPGKNKTKEIVKARYYWMNMDDDIERFVENCHACRRSKVPRDKTPGLLQSLPIPERPWQHISVDFKEFPKDKLGKDAIAVFVDRLGKRPISIPCNKTVNAKELAKMYMIYVHKYYGPATTIVSDRGPQFISAFWEEFQRLLGTKLKLSTAYHPQTDGQTENANQWIDQRLRPFVNHHQDNWSELIHVVDFAAAALPHDSTGMSSFLVELGFEPRMSFDWDRPAHTIDVSREILKARAKARDKITEIQNAWEWCRKEMARAQERQRVQANKHRRIPDFEVGDMVWVSTKNWKSDRPSRKLEYQQDGPYKILAKEGHSYRLQLPVGNNVYPVFSPDKLRKDPANPLDGQHPDPPLPVEYNNQPEWEVEEVLASKKLRRKLVYRVKWVGLDHDPVWYDAEGFKGSPHKLRAFHASYPSAFGPPVNLDYWLDCYLAGTDPDDRDDDNGWVE
jgi:transposase InsO family protein